MKNLTLVLNADDTPLNIVSDVKAFKLIYKGKAVVVTHDESRPFVSGRSVFQRPTIIRLMSYIYVPYRKHMPLTRQNVYRRDGNKCVYCSGTKNLTLDHVVPKSRGGRNTWDNLVTCCMKCNNKKDNKTPREAGMAMRVKPYAPSYVHFLSMSSGASHNDWVEYFEKRKRSD